MRKGALLITIIIFLACRKKNVPPPDNLINQTKMEAVLLDMALLTSAKNSNLYVLQQNKVVPLEFIYDKHSIDSLQFAQSNTYYAQQPELYLEIFKRVQDSLKNLQTEAQKEVDLLKIKKDSAIKVSPNKLIKPPVVQKKE